MAADGGGWPRTVPAAEHGWRRMAADGGGWPRMAADGAGRRARMAADGRGRPRRWRRPPSTDGPAGLGGCLPGAVGRHDGGPMAATAACADSAAPSAPPDAAGRPRVGPSGTEPDARCGRTFW
jgi:hypothetical protein